jgi:hypothetical protein
LPDLKAVEIRTMSDEYQIERVDSCRLLAHSDFITLPRIYTVRKLKNGEVFRVRLPLTRGWDIGAIVRLAHSQILQCAV